VHFGPYDRPVYDEAVAWAESVLGGPIADVAELPGGMTSTMLALSPASGPPAVLRLMTNEPWRSHGADLTRRERSAQDALASTAVPAPASLGIDAEGTFNGVSAHLMSRLPGVPTGGVDGAVVEAMAEMLARIHEVRPAVPFRPYQSWAWEAKWVVPSWTRHPDAWQRAFDLLAGEPPAFAPTFLHRDYSHRNLLWSGASISGVVDWVETSTGPAWLDAAHAATNLAVGFGPEPARSFLEAYGALTGTKPDRYWLVMDAVGFLPPPGKAPMFGSPGELERLDDWLLHVVASDG
jgi:aminoglycoside phosphotransferase (APT) family kinase protein